MARGMNHRSGCACNLCEKLKVAGERGRLKQFGVKLSVSTIEAIRKKCQEQQLTPREWIERAVKAG